MPTVDPLSLVSAASEALKSRADEVNRLNVFPVPDGDTGTNMSLTMEAVVADVTALGPSPDVADYCRAITHGSLMGARGNSGVILSQILRGLCEVGGVADSFDAETLANALERSVTVAFQAVRKPVEGTILTVLADSATQARRASEEGASLEEALERVVAESFESVRRTPDLLETLRINGVVDAGGYGLAILFEGFVAALSGHEVRLPDVSSQAAPLMHVAPVEDWEDDEYLYCTEFLLHGDDISEDEVKGFVTSMGGSELVVGGEGTLKIHVHTNDPGTVLSHMTQIGQVSEVHINNMRLQQQARDEALRQEEIRPTRAQSKAIGFVTVASGQGLKDILASLGADVIVSGGQTMNPSTRELLEAIESVDAQRVIVLPNNKNIVMSATAAAQSASIPAAVVPTTAIPQAFAALLAYDGGDELQSSVDAMTEAAGLVHAGEVTTAVKDAKGKVGDIRAGQIIGIADHEIEVVGDDVTEVSVQLATIIATDDSETLTVLAGADLDDDALAALAAKLEAALPDLEVETHRGDQPLYPVLLAAE